MPRFRRRPREGRPEAAKDSSGGWTEIDASEVAASGRPSPAEDLGDRCLEVPRDAGGFDALARVADDAREC